MSQNNKAVAIWFTGLSASGKSTLSEALYNKLKEKNVNNLILLDGEFVRDKLKYYGYETTNRNEIGIQKSKLALKYINKGNHTIITGIAHHKETRKIIRNMFPYFYEIYLKCDVEVCANRDFKGNYKKAFDGEYDNFIGVTEPYEESEPELIIETDKNSIDVCQKLIPSRPFQTNFLFHHITMFSYL